MLWRFITDQFAFARKRISADWKEGNAADRALSPLLPPFAL